MRTKSPDEPQATIRNKRYRNIMKPYQRITLFATVLATVTMPSSLPAQVPAVEETVAPASERQLQINNTEQEALRKLYQSAVEDMHKAKDVLRDNVSPHEETGLRLKYIRSMQWVAQIESKLRKFQPSNATKVAALTKRLDEIMLEKGRSTGDIAFHCDILATADKGIPYDNGINIVLMHTEKTEGSGRTLDKLSLHDYLKALAEDAGLVVDIGEDVVSLRHPKEADVSSTEPKDKEVDKELAFYEKIYGVKIRRVRPKSEYHNPDEFYADIAARLNIREIIDKAADAKFGSKDDNGVEIRTLARVRPSATASKPGWDIVMTCYTPHPKNANVDSAKGIVIQRLHLDFEGNVTFLERSPLGVKMDDAENRESLRRSKDAEITESDVSSSEPKDKEKDKELAFYEKTYGVKISGVDQKSEYDNPDLFYWEIAMQLNIPKIVAKAADAKFGSTGEMRRVTYVRPSATASKPGWDILMACYTPAAKNANVDSSKKIMLQRLHLDFEGNVTFLERFPAKK